MGRKMDGENFRRLLSVGVISWTEKGGIQITIGSRRGQESKTEDHQSN